MKRRIFAIINKRVGSRMGTSAMQELLTQDEFGQTDSVTMIEVNMSGIDFTPVNSEVRAVLPTINRALVERLIIIH